ncbi:MAG: 50S ribosomal protein L7/L12 [Planctomycetes bacterium]|nr:50S ribosomal protein L7/L12 [Planctomycetota bacterium]
MAEEKTATATEAGEKKAKKRVEVTGDVQKVLDAASKLPGADRANLVVKIVENLTALELSGLVDLLQDVFGVTAAAPMMAMALPGAGAGGGEAAPAAPAKTEFDLVLQTLPADKKIPVIKVVKEITGLGLKESKALVDEVPKSIKEKISLQDAEKWKKQLEEQGATVEIK